MRDTEFAKVVWRQCGGRGEIPCEGFLPLPATF
jgi:hypothetical protein